MHVIRTALGLGAAAFLLVGTAAGGASAATVSSIWHQTAACDPNASDCFLLPKAVSATSPGDVWVVGSVLEAPAAAPFLACFPRARSFLLPKELCGDAV